MPIFLLLPLLAACQSGPAPAVDCAAVAVAGVDGEPDPCDLAACTSCVESCGTACAVLQSYPPQYRCDAYATWTAFDTCPGWQPPGGWEAVEVEVLGCGDPSAPGLTAVHAGGGRVEVTHLDAVTGCCPTGARVLLEVASDVLELTYVLENDLCECACELDFSYALEDVPSGVWTLHSEPSGATATVTVP